MNIILGLLQAFIALGAIAAGFIFIKDPSGASLGFSVSILEGSIFPDFLVPGLFLFLVNGVGSLVGAVLSFTKNRYAAPAAMALGAILVAWIVIQVSIIRSIHWLHGLYFGLGLVEFALGVLLSRRQKMAANA
ncbi:MAG TPA: hypothetical protein VLD65_12940 [Anaerolineales bacterium]|nr:hypothetical protein [Anaerolineales bacterium]